MFLKRKVLPVTLLLLLLAGAGLAWWNLSTVTTGYVKLQRGDAVETLLAAGKVVSEATIPLSFTRAGLVAEMLVQEGDLVEEGDLLLTLENSREHNLIKQRENALARGRVSLERLRSEETASAAETVNQAKLQQNYAEEVYERNLELYQEGIISSTELEQAEQSLKHAASTLALAEITLQGLQNTALRLARLEVEQAEVLMEEATLQLEATFLHAPQSGKVIRSLVNRGEYVQPGQPLLQLVPAADYTYVEVEVDEDLSGRVMLGQAGIITVSAFQGKEFGAKVSRIAPSIDASRGTFTVRLTLDEHVPSLPPDLAVFAEIITGQSTNVLILEQRYLSRDGDKTYIYTLENEQARQRELLTENLGNGLVAVLQGLEEGELILTALELRDGQRVRLLGESE